MVDVNVVVQERKYSPSKVKGQVDKDRSRVRVNLGLAFTHTLAQKERLGKSWFLFWWAGQCQAHAVSLG